MGISDEIKEILSGLALVSLFIIAILIIGILVNVPIPIINPPAQQNEIPLINQEWLNSINPAVPPDCQVAIYLRYYGTLVTTTKVTVSAIIYLETPAAQKIASASIGFPQSLSYPLENNSLGYPNSVSLILTNNEKGELVGNTTSIYFPSPGDYTREVDLIAKNGTLYTETSIPGIYDVQVSPASELLTEKFDKVDEVLSLALVYFAFIEVSYLYIDHKKKSKNKQEDIEHQKAIENRQEELIREIKTLSQKLDRTIATIPKNPHNRDTQSDQPQKKRVN
jgi:hypothetical protein